jgi:hypothetical protein
MLRRILPWRFQSVTNFLNENTNFVFRSVLNTPPIKCNPEAAVDYTSLVCHRDVNIYILATKSFLRFHNKVSVVVHSDGTLTRSDATKLREHIPGIRIITRDEEEDKVNAEVGSTLLKDVRKRDVSFIKLIDVNLFSQKRKIIADSDLLFLREPSEVIHWIESGEEKPFHHINPDANKKFWSHLVELNKRLDTNIETLNYCSGFIGYSNQPTLADIERVTKELLAVGEGWGLEQCVYAFMLAQTSQELPQEKYLAVMDDPSDADIHAATMIHFVGKLKHSQYLRLARKTIEELATARTI